jgi:Uma2 family endonuclease
MVSRTQATRIQARAPASPPDPLPTTPHWRDRTGLTLADIDQLASAGAFTEFDRLELINGRLVEMSPKNVRHENVRNQLTYFLTIASATTPIFVSAEPQFNLADDLYRNPDILLHPKSIMTPNVRGPTSTLVIEIADTSLQSDLRVKAQTYAAHGVREYWVIAAWSLVTTVHRDPSVSGYNTVVEIADNRPLVPTLAPLLTVQLNQFGFNTSQTSQLIR